MFSDLQGKAAFVTGGSSGIGRAVALLLASYGTQVAIIARNPARGAAVVREIEQAGGAAVFIAADVGVPIEVEQAINAVVARFGRLDIAVNNAAAPPSEIGALLPMTDIEVEHFDRIIEVNLKGPWLGMKYAIPHMAKAGGGAVVNVSSIAGGRGMRGMSHYVASKFGLNGLTRSAALEFAAAKVRVNAVMPGPVDSPILREMEIKSPGYSATISGMVPMGRMGLDQEIAQAVAWLCSDAASYITGSVIAVDGGILA